MKSKRDTGYHTCEINVLVYGWRCVDTMSSTHNCIQSIICRLRMPVNPWCMSLQAYSLGCSNSPPLPLVFVPRLSSLQAQPNYAGTLSAHWQDSREESFLTDCASQEGGSQPASWWTAGRTQAVSLCPQALPLINSLPREHTRHVFKAACDMKQRSVTWSNQLLLTSSYLLPHCTDYLAQKQKTYHNDQIFTPVI